MGAPLVSIVVRSMGRPELDEALASIAAQDWPNLEVLLVNARGPGHPPPPAAAGRHPVRFLDSASGRTRPEAANAGWDAAAGEWVGFLDDDDLYLPGHTSTLMRQAAARPDCGVIYGAARWLDAQGRVTKVDLRPFGRIDLFHHVPFHLSAVVVARALRDRGLRFDPGFAVFEDWEFWLQAAEKTVFAAVPDHVGVYRFELGKSGCSEGANRDAGLIDQYLVRIAAKWKARGEALMADYTRTVQAAQAALDARRLEDAERLFDQAGRLWGANPDPAFGLGVTLAIGGRVPEAKRQFERAVGLAPDDAGCLCNLAMACLKLGQLDEARGHAATLAARWPDYGPGQALRRQLR